MKDSPPPGFLPYGGVLSKIYLGDLVLSKLSEYINFFCILMAHYDVI